MNATALPEKQEVRRNPKADGDGFMASINYCFIDIVSVLFWVVNLCAEEWACLTCHCEDLKRRILACRWLSGPAGAKLKDTQKRDVLQLRRIS